MIKLVVMYSVKALLTACFSIWVFLLRTFTNHRAAIEDEKNSFSLLYHFQPLHRHLDICQRITTESSALPIASETIPKPGTLGFWTQVANL